MKRFYYMEFRNINGRGSSLFGLNWIIIDVNYRLLYSETDGWLILQTMAIYFIDSLLVSFVGTLNFNIEKITCAVVFGVVLSRLDVFWLPYASLCFRRNVANEGGDD